MKKKFAVSFITYNTQYVEIEVDPDDDTYWFDKAIETAEENFPCDYDDVDVWVL